MTEPGDSQAPLLGSAHAYARQGWAVLPLVPRDKTPLTQHGVKDASTNEAQIREWWETWLEANIGVACGEPSGIVVLAVDTRNGGDIESWLELGLNETLLAHTGGGGLHLVFENPGVSLLGKLRDADGVDIKSTGGYISVAPSVHPGGQTYRWDAAGADVRRLTPSLLARMCRPDKPARVHAPPDPTDDRPGTRFNAEAKWEDILKPNGWRFAGSGPDGVDCWTRPGKDAGISLDRVRRRRLPLGVQ